MSAIDHSHIPNTDSSWQAPARPSTRTIRDLIAEYAQALRAAALAERDHRHANAIRALYFDDSNSRPRE